jgi:hypothetical protein
LIEELLFDPRFDEKEFITKSQEIIDLGFSKPIIQSELYKIPDLKLTTVSLK